MEFDKDLAARQEARDLSRQAEQAQRLLAEFPQEKLDRIVEAMARAFSAAAVELAELAVAETGFGNAEDKVTKNRFASETVLGRIRDMKCVGVLNESPKEKLWEIGVPVGVIAAIVPSTNPTSTVCDKAMMALKSGNACVLRGGKEAFRSANAIVAAMQKGLKKVGMEATLVQLVQDTSRESANELMHLNDYVDVLIPRGGAGLINTCVRTATVNVIATGTGGRMRTFGLAPTAR